MNLRQSLAQLIAGPAFAVVPAIQKASPRTSFEAAYPFLLAERRDALMAQIAKLRRQKKRHSHVQAQLKAVTAEILKLEGGRQ